jgi:hypothetical protein
MKWLKVWWAGIALLFGAAASAAVIQVDARDLDGAWADAETLPALKLTQPDTGAEPPFRTDVRWAATADGLAFFFRNDQDEAVYPRRAPRQARDNLDGSDRVNVMLDFDGTGQAGYNLTLSRANSIEDSTISNENLFSPDWDGVWSHAVRERQGGWDAEILLPWSSVLMRAASGKTRTIKLYVDRVVGATGDRAAYPEAIFFRPTFLSNFAAIEVPVYSASLLKFYPYTSVQADLNDGGRQFRSGLDVFWKPTGSFQLTGAINPDFGQVEADDLVINFDAIEVFFSDRRPFFTENQSGFVLQSPEGEPLIYTRRVGATRDDRQGISDIDVALKVSGSYAGFDYGVFAVQEAEAQEVGKTFAALRVKRPSERVDIGTIFSRTERPFRDRIAQVGGIDGEWRATEQLTLRGTLLGSDIEQAGSTRRGVGGWTRAVYEFSDDTDVRLEWTRYDPKFDFNDLGFQRRNNLSLLELSIDQRRNQFAEGSALRQVTRSFDIDWNQTSGGRRLRSFAEVGLGVGFVDGGEGYVEVSKRLPGADDLISRGNGILRVDGGFSVFTEYTSPRIERWRYSAGAYFQRDGLQDRLFNAFGVARFFYSDAFSVQFGISSTDYSERVLWRQGTLFGRFADSESFTPEINLEWFGGARHELRLKMQSLGVSSRNAAPLRLGANERLQRSADSVSDFAVSTFGAQFRYRYKINAESDLYVVYGRGGERDVREFDPAFELVNESIAFSEINQLLIKLRYAF